MAHFVAQPVHLCSSSWEPKQPSYKQPFPGQPFVDGWWFCFRDGYVGSMSSHTTEHSLCMGRFMSDCKASRFPPQLQYTGLQTSTNKIKLQATLNVITADKPRKHRPSSEGSRRLSSQRTSSNGATSAGCLGWSHNLQAWFARSAPVPSPASKTTILQTAVPQTTIPVRLQPILNTVNSKNSLSRVCLP